MRQLIFFLNSICIFALGVAYTSPYISPQYCHIPQLFGLFYPYIFLANLAFVFFWVLFHKSYAKYSFLMLLVSFFYMPRIYKFGNTSVQNNEQSLKLLTYNVKKFGTDDKGKITNPSALFEFISAQDASFICFQEYSNSRYLKYGKSLLNKKYPYVHTEGEIATFSHFPIVAKKSINFNKENYAKGILTNIALGKDTVCILNVHLESNQLSSKNKQDLMNLVNNKGKNFKKIFFVGNKLKRASLRRAQQMEKLVDIIKKSHYPIILCGDFNDTPMSYSYQRIKNLLDDSFIKVGKGSGKTFSEGIINVRIDYVFTKLKMTKHQVHNEQFSDHKPVEVIFDGI